MPDSTLGEPILEILRRSGGSVITLQKAAWLVKGLPYGSIKETCPVTALRQWLQAADRQVEGGV